MQHEKVQEKVIEWLRNAYKDNDFIFAKMDRNMVIPL
ncbi:hypothetical protein J2Y02_004313 [Neobacillus drentensis]|nr:hypothetical protein [Neobacillus drentensis]